ERAPGHVDVALPHRLQHQVSVREEFELDLAERRLRSAPVGVALEDDPVPGTVLREVERAIRYGLAVGTANAARPDLVEILAFEREGRIQPWTAGEEATPVRVRGAGIVGRALGRSPKERDAPETSMHEVRRVEMVVRLTAGDVVARVVHLLECVDEVLVGDRDLLAAPVPERP